MADRSPSPESTLQTSSANRPLLSALSRWWAPAAEPSGDPVLGYESAHPWTLADDTPDNAGLSPY